MVKLFDALRTMLHGIEHYHDSSIISHEENTGKMMNCLASALGYNKKYCLDLEQTGNIHDIGKLALPSQILEKPSKLNGFEREILEMHPTIGSKMLDKIDHPLAKLAASINLHHHEAYDGTGYPHGIKKDQIPIEARICSLCDVYDAIRAHRPYHEGIATHKTVVLQILSKKTNGLFHKFDPSILEVFAEMHEEFDSIFCSNLNT
ncbi:TPA: HD domain-containing protein [Legionella pneumophila]|nr:HD domain-containing protein [Legionella pneumophila]